MRKVFTDPGALDPSKRAAKVTREVAEHLAKLAQELESAGHAQELVARFLMRCLFTMFAEDVNLLPDKVFTQALKDFWVPNPASFCAGVEQLWRTMNDGGHTFGVAGRILQFNGGLFKSPEGLPLDAKALRILLSAAECDWSDVEPAIFGTLLERALDAKERHRLGAHFTPRAYVERLVKPTLEEPLREEWDAIRVEVRSLLVSAEKAKAGARTKKLNKTAELVRDFHKRLLNLRILDPACGTGNFLYVSMDVLKRLESEVLAQLADVEGGDQDLMHLQGVRISPEQFLGIEIKPWAKEIAELVLWIDYLQWHYRQYGKSFQVPEPVLRDYQNIECRDAVLAYDREELVLDEKGKPVTRWDGSTMKQSPVTGKEVPDESAQVPLYRYVNPRKAEWPKADFIVGNPPFLGKLKLLAALGEGYVAGLRHAYANDVPDGVDYVMYWWARAAVAVAHGETIRFGLITTKSITQTMNRRVLASAMEHAKPISLVFAIPNHPWVDSVDGAAVRIAMTAGCAGQGHEGLMREVRTEVPTSTDGVPQLAFFKHQGRIQSDLRVGTDVTTAQPLISNSGLAATGFLLGNRGFVLERAPRLANEPAHKEIIFELRNGRDFTDRSRELLVIDVTELPEEQLRNGYPEIYQHLRTTVFPERQQNRDPRLRREWWKFRRSNEKLRNALRDLPRYIVTSETAKHRVFFSMPSTTARNFSIVQVS